MKFDYLKEKKKPFAIVLLGISAILGVVILIKVAGFFVASARAEQLVKNAAEHSKADPNDTEKYLAKSKTLADKLKKKNLFVPPKPKQQPVKQVSGIMGQEALINGKFYKVGDKIADAKIVAIEPKQVTIKWEGKEIILAPLNAAGTPEPKKRAKKPPAARKRGRMAARPAKIPAENKTVAAPQEQDPLAWMGVKLSPAARAKLMEHWNKMSDEQKEKMKEQWNSMSDEQKQQAVDSMEKQA